MPQSTKTRRRCYLANCWNRRTRWWGGASSPRTFEALVVGRHTCDVQKQHKAWISVSLECVPLSVELDRKIIRNHIPWSPNNKRNIYNNNKLVDEPLWLAFEFAIAWHPGTPGPNGCACCMCKSVARALEVKRANTDAFASTVGIYS